MGHSWASILLVDLSPLGGGAVAVTSCAGRALRVGRVLRAARLEGAHRSRWQLVARLAHNVELVEHRTEEVADDVDLHPR